jgi:hypothetical protein
MRKFFTLQEKRDIVDEAWELPGIIKAVARKYGIGFGKLTFMISTIVILM